MARDSDAAETDASRLWQRLFVSDDVDDVRSALQGAVGEALLDELGKSLEAALEGDEQSARIYVADFSSVTGKVLDIAAPDFVFEARRVRIVVDAKNAPRSRRARPPESLTSTEQAKSADLWTARWTADALRQVLLNASVDAPLSPWIGTYGTREGVALHLVARARMYLPKTAPLAEPERKAIADFDPMALPHFLMLVRRCIDWLDQPSPLENVMRAFDLDKSSTAQLFGVTRQAVTRWLKEGRVPAERQEKLSVLASLADLLERKLKRGRLPGIVRRPAEAYGGLSMLEMVVADRHDELLRSVRESFEWERAA